MLAIFFRVSLLVAVATASEIWVWLGGNYSHYSPLQGSHYNYRGPEGRAGFNTAVNGSNLFLFGGKSKGKEEYYWNDMWVYDTVQSSWRNLSGSQEPNAYGKYNSIASPGSRWKACLSYDYLTHSIWLYGGFGFSIYNRTGLLSDLWRYHGSSWYPVYPNYELDLQPEITSRSIINSGSPGGRESASSWNDFKGKFWIFGGTTADSTLKRDLWVFTGNKWIFVSDYGPEERKDSSCWSNGVYLYIYGGYGGSQRIYGDMWKFSTIAYKWIYIGEGEVESRISTDYPTPRFGAAFGSFDGDYYLYGGNSHFGLLRDLWMFDSVVDKWELLTQYDISAANATEIVGDLFEENLATRPSSSQFGGLWIDNKGRIYLFGGETPSSSYQGLMFMRPPNTFAERATDQGSGPSGQNTNIVDGDGGGISITLDGSKLPSTSSELLPTTSLDPTTMGLTSTTPTTTMTAMSLTSTTTTNSLTAAETTTSLITTSSRTTAEITTTPITTSPLTTAEITTSPITTSPLTTAEITTSPITTSPLTPSEMTTSLITTSPLTTDEITTSPITTSPFTTDETTTSPITTSPLTPSEMTTSLITTSSLTSAEQTTQVLTTSHLTSRDLSTSQITSEALTTLEFTSQALTTSPLSTQEATTSEVTTQMLTTSQLTTSHITSSYMTTNLLTTSTVPLTTSLQQGLVLVVLKNISVESNSSVNLIDEVGSAPTFGDALFSLCSPDSCSYVRLNSSRGLKRTVFTAQFRVEVPDFVIGKIKDWNIVLRYRINESGVWKFLINSSSQIFSSMKTHGWNEVEQGKSDFGDLEKYVNNKSVSFQAETSDEGTLDFDVMTINVLVPEEATVEQEASESKSVALPVALGVVGVALVAIVALVALFLVRSRQRGGNRDSLEMDESQFYLTVKFATKLGMLGSGNFGIVYKGTAFGGTPVALKQMKSATPEEILSEAGILTRVQHPNCVRFYGVYTENNTPYLVMEFCEQGSLLDLVLKKTFTINQLLDMAHEAAKGMAYLEDMNIVHRDLGCRNLLVDAKGVVKVADFGMSKILDSKVYERIEGAVPIRWSSPEVLKFKKFSSASDSWSFGIVLFELMSNGTLPYSGMSNIEVLEAVTEQNYRLPKPKGCPLDIWNLMCDCWKEDPSERPTFKEICDRIEEIKKFI